MKVKKGMLGLLIALTLFLSACSMSNQVVTKTEFLLGTIIDITLYEKSTDDMFVKAFDSIQDIDNKMSINKVNSEVIKINQNAGKKYVRVSDETFEVIKEGKNFSNLSNGKFDISIGPLVKLWNIGSDDAKVPTDDEIIQKKSLVNYNDILLNESDHSVMLKKEGMMLDLGGIAKGYAADTASITLESMGVEKAILNLGGNVYALGSSTDNDPWKIGIQNPFTNRGDYIGYVSVENKTVVTSGIYERYFEQNGKRYHHILDPQTGFPVENNLASVSIITSNSTSADALSTTMFSLGIKDGLKLAQSLPDTEVIFVTKDKQIYLTDGIKDNFQLKDNSFTIKN